MAVDHRGGLRRLFDGGTVVASSERQLLDRFLSARDELAFEAIVKRHGPMVVGVCRSVLRDEADIDDAFQATFLVLVKKAGSLRDADQLSPWLHGVARKVALQARAVASKRRVRETLGVEIEPAAPDPSLGNAEHREMLASIHAEIDRLSPPERSVLLLCDLQGLSHQEAADQLGWPLGTVKARITRGRDRLRSRLIRRGVSLSSGLLASGLAAESSASIFISPSLIATTTRAALALAAGRALSVGLISAPVATLTQGAVRAMIFTKLKAGAIALAATTSVLAVPSLVAYQEAPRQDPSGQNKVVAPMPKQVVTPTSPERIGVKDASQSSRLGLAEAVVQRIVDGDREKNPVIDQFRLTWYHRLAEAQLEVATTQVERVKAVESYIERVQQFSTELARGIVSKTIGEITSKGREVDASVLDERWNAAGNLVNILAEGKKWLAKVQAEQIEFGPKNGRLVGNPMGATLPLPSDGPFGNGGIKPTSIQGTERPRIETLPDDENRQRAILAKLDERIAMPFANETPLSDILKYIESVTQDEPTGLPTGIPIYYSATLKGRGKADAA